MSPDGRTLVVSERTPSADRMALVLWDVDGTNPRRVYQDDVTVMGLEWSPDGRWLTFGAGAFFLGRSRGPAEIMIMKADGSEVRAVTSGPGNAGFPSWSPDGTEIMYRYWTGNERGEGLRIVDVATGRSRVLTTEYDTLPFWSPRGDGTMHIPCGRPTATSSSSAARASATRTSRRSSSTSRSRMPSCSS